jgi:hypothetical protein
MTSPTFVAEAGAVCWLTGRGTIRLDLEQADRLLDVFENATGAAAAHLWNQLYEAVFALTGIERCTSHKRVAA